MAAERALVGLDVGTSSVKGVAIGEGGEVLAVAEAEHPLSTPRPGWSEQDPEDWWRGTQRVLAELGEGREVAGIGLSGQMHGLVTLDAQDRPIRSAILWNDGRSQPQCDALEERLGRERLVALVGNRAVAGFTAPKLLWMREHEPEELARVAHVLLPKDYVRLRLCGERATDVADASGTLLLDVARRRWSDELLGLLELDRAWLPELAESPAQTGATPDGIPVAAGAGDQPAGALGVGVDRPGPLSVVLGTSGVVFAALDAYGADPEGRVQAFCHAAPGAWDAFGVMLSAAGSLRWVRDVAAPGVPFGELVEEAARWEPGVEGLVFLPYLAGERTPHFDASARGAFDGLSLRHDRGALVRAVLEGVAYGLRDGLDLVREAGGEGGRAEVGRVSGGGARSELWLQVVASVLELPLERVAVEEGAAYGAALLGGVAAGVWGDVHEAVAACVRTGGRVEPVPAWVEAYREGRERFRALHPALSAVRRATAPGRPA